MNINSLKYCICSAAIFGLFKANAAQPMLHINSVPQPDGSLSIQADPGGYGTFTVVFHFTSWDNVALSRTDTVEVDGYGEILRLRPDRPDRPVEVRYTYDWIQGKVDPQADTAFVYRLPYETATTATVRSVSNYEAGRGHRGGTANLQIKEFSVPEGETVYAVRRGKVIGIDNLDRPLDGQPHSNPTGRIRIEHSDGTIAAYSMLENGSALVSEGQIVTPSTPLARAGATQDGKAAVRLEVFRYVTNRSAGPKNAGVPFVARYIDPIFATASGDTRLTDGDSYRPRVTRRLINEEKPRCGLRGCNIK